MACVRAGIPKPRRPWSPSLVALAACVALAVACLTPVDPIQGSGTDGEPVGSGWRLEDESVWQEFDRLIDEGRLESARKLAERRLEEARAGGDTPAWTSALIRRAQATVAGGSFETAVTELRAAEWPEGALDRALLSLFEAHLLATYGSSYSWEILQRERMGDRDELPIDRWTMVQIRGAAIDAFESAWAARDLLGGEPQSAYAPFLVEATYPDRIRPTLRDAVTYLYAGFLVDTSLTPAGEDDLFLLDLGALLDPPAAGEGVGEDQADASETEVAGDRAAVSRMVEVLADLERWHRERGETGAALEASLERHRLLLSRFSAEADRDRIRDHLAGVLEIFRDDPWWAWGMATLADLRRSDRRDPERLIDARSLARAGADAYPASLGGERCRRIVAAIEAPELQVLSMAVDAPGRRSIEVRHKNLDRVHFAAFAVADPLSRLLRPGGQLFPHGQELEALLAGEPLAAWQVELPPTPDFEVHATYVTPPLETSGSYVIVASSDERIRPGADLLTAVGLTLGDLVLLREDAPGELAVRALVGSSGEVARGTEVGLYVDDYRSRPRRLGEAEVDHDGVARFPAREQPLRGRAFFLARRAGEVAVLPAGAAYRDRQEAPPRSALLFTDRSVYRPGQRLYFKVVVYDGEPGGAGFRSVEGVAVTVALTDPNGEEVGSVDLATGAFGTASGELRIPTGRPLGAWMLATSLGGRARPVQVEEYRRPTFEVELGEADGEPRLNRPVRLFGKAGYYFGQPVAGAPVRWRVTREPLWPPWIGFRPLPRQPVILAGGETTTGADGRFELTFTPLADERLDGPAGLSYLYRLSVDVTEPGGETRSAARVYRLGVASVEAEVRLAAGFVEPGAPARVTVERRGLDGEARPGEGRWRVLLLEQPPRALLPSELPADLYPGGSVDGPPPVGGFAPTGGGPEEPDSSGGYRTPGDRLRPRWASAPETSEIVRGWRELREVAGGRLVHDEGTTAEVEVGSLPPGAYRFVYETEDAGGITVRAAAPLLVAGEPLAIAGFLAAARDTVRVGETATLWVGSGLAIGASEQTADAAATSAVRLELFHGSYPQRRRLLAATDGRIELPVTAELRGGFSLRLSFVRDHQLVSRDLVISVPWERELGLSFSTLRERFRPGDRETFRVEVRAPDGEPAAAGRVELLAYLVDRSLDAIYPHRPTDPLELYPRFGGPPALSCSLGLGSGLGSWRGGPTLPAFEAPAAAYLRFLDHFRAGGPGGIRTLARTAESPMMEAAMGVEADAAPMESRAKLAGRAGDDRQAPPPEPIELRRDFRETALWQPHLVVGADGAASFEVTFPDSVTSWQLWAHALTRDLAAGSIERRIETAKDLLVRPTLPRFLRQGDTARLRAVITNAGRDALAGTATFAIVDPESGDDLTSAFGLDRAAAERSFRIDGGGAVTLSFDVEVPPRLGEVEVRVSARAGDWTDGELRRLPLLPARYVVSESRFATVPGGESRVLAPATSDDPSRRDELLVATLDAHLLDTVLAALPHIVDYPYDSTDVAADRLAAAATVIGLDATDPSIRRQAAALVERDTLHPAWDDDDPNRRMALEETPWLRAARGGDRREGELLRLLAPGVAEAVARQALVKLREAQLPDGGFSWWPDGPASPFITLSVLHRLARALDSGAPAGELGVPLDLVARAWQYLDRTLELGPLGGAESDRRWRGETLILLAYVASSYPDPSWLGGALAEERRDQILERAFEDWQSRSPYLKLLLAVTLERAGRGQDARRLLESVFDGARSDPDRGISWAPEERSWLWYNDTVAGHAAALEALSEIAPDDPRRHGLVRWLLLNKKLNHWGSPRVTAETVHSLIAYQRAEGLLGKAGSATVTAVGQTTEVRFEPGAPNGGHRQIVFGPAELGQADDEQVRVDNTGPQPLFASATWHYSSESLAAVPAGDLFAVTRRAYRRLRRGSEMTLEPLADGARVEVGDEVEIRLTVRALQSAEYVHLADPRPAGFEPAQPLSGWQGRLGLTWYEEVRDSGANFFIEWLPAGEVTLAHRLRAQTAGRFRQAPATLQSLYAPEFTAHTAAGSVTVDGDRPSGRE